MKKATINKHRAGVILPRDFFQNAAAGLIRPTPGMKGFVINIEKATKDNKNFRQVLYTAKNSQLVVMNLQPSEEIGDEIHELDQFIRVEKGRGKVILDGVEHPLEEEMAVVIPAGTKHNVINIDVDDELKLYTIYSPPEHKDAVVHATKAEAEADATDHFDGKTTE